MQNKCLRNEEKKNEVGFITFKAKEIDYVASS